MQQDVEDRLALHICAWRIASPCGPFGVASDRGVGISWVEIWDNVWDNFTGVGTLRSFSTVRDQTP